MRRKTDGSATALYFMTDTRMLLCVYYLADEVLERQIDLGGDSDFW